MKVKAVIFDLDGTLADTIESIATACNIALEKCGLEKRPIEEYHYFAGDGADTLVKRALAASGDLEGKNHSKALEYYLAFFETGCTYKVSPFDGIIELLEELKASKMKLAVLTNKPHNRAITVIEALFPDYFDIVVGQQKGKKRKPDPTEAIQIAKDFELEPRECAYVGDTDVDMQTGNRADMFTIGVLWGFRTKEELQKNNAHAIVKNPHEIIELLK